MEAISGNVGFSGGCSAGGAPVGFSSPSVGGRAALNTGGNNVAFGNSDSNALRTAHMNREKWIDGNKSAAPSGTTMTHVDTNMSFGGSSVSASTGQNLNVMA